MEENMNNFEQFKMETSNQNDNVIRFESNRDSQSIIKVIGIGGGGSNAVNHMYKEGIRGVDFVVCNTDVQALNNSTIPCKIQLGTKLTSGLGAGSKPEMGKKAAEESIDEVMDFLKGTTNMVFLTAGMGGGTGTGAAPVIAEACRNQGILTVAIVTTPFVFEGKKRMKQAEEGIAELKKHVDTLIIICNEKVREIHGNLGLTGAFAHADNVLLTSARGIAEIITKNGYINVDFNDIKTIMTDGGTAILGYALASGEGRAMQVIENALNSPLLLDNKIQGANQVLIVVSSSKTNEITMDEVGEICDFVQDEAGMDANVILGAAFDESLGDNISVVVIATGFEATNDFSILPKSVAKEKQKEAEVIVHKLDAPEKKEIQPEIAPEMKLVVKQPEVITTEQVVNQVNAEQKVSEPIPAAEVKQPEILGSKGEFATDNMVHNKITDTVTTQEAPSPVSNNVHIAEKNNAINSTQQDLQTKKIHQDRIRKLKDMSIKLKNPNLSQSTIHELENQPAYERKNISLDKVVPSDESHISKFSLDSDSDNQLKQNNSFLHDNVD